MLLLEWSVESCLSVNLVNCEPLLHQIKKRLSSWTVKSLSFAGRLLLIKTVISGITTFWCAAFILPKACIKRINSLCSIFLWKGDIESNNTARVAWEKCVLTKEQGGLGIRDLQTWNLACCIKLIWLLFFKGGLVWVAWFTEKVLKGSVHNYWTTKPSTSYSWLANKLLKLKSVVFPLIKLRLEDGLTARFWYDNWSPFGSMATTLNISVSRLGIPDKATVASLFTNGAWRLPPARSEPQLLLHTFLTTITLTQNPDYYEWEIAGKVCSTYSTGSTYSYLRGDLDEVSWASAVWFSYGIPRQQFHTWLVVLDRCPTRDRLLSWGLQTSPLCLLCNNDHESRDHIYFNCSYSFDLWELSASRCSFQPRRSWNQTLQQMQALPKQRAQRSDRLLTLLAWQSNLYWIWNERNSRLHTNSFSSINALFTIIDRQIRNRVQGFRSSNPNLASSMMQMWFRHVWSSPPQLPSLHRFVSTKSSFSLGQGILGFTLKEVSSLLVLF